MKNSVFVLPFLVDLPDLQTQIINAFAQIDGNCYIKCAMNLITELMCSESLEGDILSICNMLKKKFVSSSV